MRTILMIGLAVFILSAPSAITAAAESSPAQTAQYVYLYDGTKPDLASWKDKYDDNSPTEARISLDKPNVPPGFTRAKVEGISTTQSFGNVYQDVTLDINKYPFLEVDVDSANGMWYIIVMNEDLKHFEQESDGGSKFFRVQADNLMLGKFRYNIKEMTGLSGLVTLRFKIGVATGLAESINKGKWALIKYIRFSSI